MGSFLLTWNPTKWKISDDEWLAAVEGVTRGVFHSEPWSIGSRTGGIELGDRLFLVRVHSDRGIVASGTAVSHAYKDSHWDETRARRGDLANYVDVEWDWQVPIEDRIPVETLKSHIPRAPWDNLMGSGVQLSSDDARDLIQLWSSSTPPIYPEEESPLVEGGLVSVRVNRYERNPRARAACLAHHGSACVVCGFHGGSVFGQAGEGLIHVHHLMEVSRRKGPYVVDPIRDLVPVCPTCHAMIHARRPPYTPAEVRAMRPRRNTRRAHS
jgi:5-methylcytosine-specific restriction protein A